MRSLGFRVEVADQHLDRGPKVLVVIDHLADLLVAMHHGGVIAVSEEASDVLPGVARNLARDVDGDVPRMDDGSLARGSFDVVTGDLEVLADGLDDLRVAGLGQNPGAVVGLTMDCARSIVSGRLSTLA